MTSIHEAGQLNAKGFNVMNDRSN